MASKKEIFIKEISDALVNLEDFSLSDDARTYFEALKGGVEKDKPAFTENGKIVLQYMKDNKEIYNNLFKAKEIGDGIGISSRTASGAMRKLVTDGYVEKLGENPVTYSLTTKGIEININVE